MDSTEALPAREIAAAAISAALAQDNLCAAFQMTAAAGTERPALRTYGKPDVISWSDYAARVEGVAGGLHALGVRAGDAVGLMMRTRPEYFLVHTAAMHLGAQPFGIYHTNPPAQVRPLIENSDARVVIVETDYAATVAAVAAEMPELEHVVVVGADAGPGTTTLADIEALSRTGFDFEASWRAVNADTIATIVYTSGTTGEPKGVEWSHGALVQSFRNIAAQAPPSPLGRWLAFLPMAHLAELFCGHFAQLLFGYEVTCLIEASQLESALAEVRPTRMFGVPRIYEKLAASFQEAAAADDEFRDVFAASLEAVQAGRKVPRGAETTGERVHERLGPLRRKLGLDALEYAQSSAAPIRHDVLEVFEALGCPLTEVWGMSETATILANPLGRRRIGTVGIPLPGAEVRLAEDGELLVRGPIFTRYRMDPERTSEAFDAEGWFKTGDIAAIDDDGWVRIIDRKKEIIINAAGKNIPPVMVENRIKRFSPLIDCVAAIGDARRYVTALITLAPAALEMFAVEHHLTGSYAELAASGPVQAEIDEAVARANATLARAEQVKRFRILDAPWLPGGDELTTTLKLRRRVIAQKHAAEIDALYIANPVAGIAGNGSRRS